MVEDGALQVALVPGRLLAQAEELQHHGSLDHVLGAADALALTGEGADLIGVAAHREALVEQLGDLALQLTGGSALPSGLDLVEAARGGVADPEQGQGVGPAEGGRKEARAERRRRSAVLSDGPTARSLPPWSADPLGKLR